MIQRARTPGRTARAGALALALGSLTGCTLLVGLDDGEAPKSPKDLSIRTEGPPLDVRDGDGGGGGGGGGGPVGEDERPSPSSRVARLTPLQWENAVRDLFLLEEHTGFSSELSLDALPGDFLFDNPSDTLRVDAVQWAGFSRAAARVAEHITTDPTRLARVLPEADDDAARARAFIEQVGARAHRRPLTAEQVDAYLAVYETGRTGYPDVEPFTGGIRLVIEALLQSPFFLYRVELSDEVVEGAAGETIPLDPYETAARLSFALWGSLPDEQLFEAARAGELDRAGVEAHARRMLEDPRATAALLHFHAQLLEAEKLAGVSPSAAIYPDAPSDLGALARREMELFLEHVFEADQGFSDILTSTTTFVNDDLARIYGLEGDFPEDELVQVELDPALRRGIFTHVAFLAQFSSATEPDPIHRGVFLAKNVACIPLGAPPADLPPLPAVEPNQTGRERTAQHTETVSPCMDCHRDIINPFGFVYEGYDALGAVRTHDNGVPVDTAASPLLDGAPTPVADGVELAQRMAESPGIHRCYAKHWMEFTFGRPMQHDDGPLVERLAGRSEGGEPIREMLVSLVTSPAFLERSVTEVGGAP